MLFIACDLKRSIGRDKNEGSVRGRILQTERSHSPSRSCLREAAGHAMMQIERADHPPETGGMSCINQTNIGMRI